MANSKDKLAFLIVCWNNHDIIDECLTAIKSQTYKNTDIYVIDNASSDSTAEFVKKNHPDVHLLASDKNNGFAKGNNILIREALKDQEVGYVALVNSDAVLDMQWADELMNFARTKRNVAAIQGITLDYFKRNVIDAAHVYVRPDFQSVQYGYLEQFGSKFDYPRRVFGVNAAAAMYSRAFIESQHEQVLFDEKFFMYLEDVDVCFRALVTGWDNFYVPAAKAYHMGSVSSKKRSSTFNIEYTVRNQSSLLFKNMPFIVFLRLLPNALRFEKNFYRYVEEDYGKRAKTKMIKMRIVGLLRLPIFTLDRIRVMRNRKISTATLIRIMNNEGIV